MTSARVLDAAALRHLRFIDKRVQWLSCWTIHHANHIRESRDGLKVGGHQASCASMNAIMTALYFHTLRPVDRVAVKPHGSPVFHAIQYLYGRQTRDQLERFRALGGAQSYPSRTKDKDDVDFSTGSVGMGVAVTAFASLAQDWLRGKDMIADGAMGRMIAVLGDAELDEGNIYEALLESYKHDMRNLWWIVDYNRQSLDAIATERMFGAFDQMFGAAGWDVVFLKYGKAQREMFARPGGDVLKAWIDSCPNADYAALTYQGGAAWRKRLKADIDNAKTLALVAGMDDAALADLMTGLGGHCLETLIEAFTAASQDDRRRLFIAYTIKGHGLPFQGHKDNHAGLMTPAQMDAYRKQNGIAEGQEWEPFAGLSDHDAGALREFIGSRPFGVRSNRRFSDAPVPVPDRAAFPRPFAEKESTQGAFGKILNEIARVGGTLAERIVTSSPDVTVSTNLGPFVNRRGIFSRTEHDDVFAREKLTSAQKWFMGPKGQHVELGIAENNLFLVMAAFGLSHSLFGKRLMPIGTLYDPFIARGLDALNYACYQDARFMLVATPSGITLAPEGGAHQSMNTPLIGMGQDRLSSFDPAYADELAEIMRWGFQHMQDEDGGSVYLRLSTRVLAQPSRTLDDRLAADIIAGGYWLRAPSAGAELAIVASGVIMPEALEAFDALAEDIPGLGLLNVTSPDRLHLSWREAGLARARGDKAHAHVERLLDALPSHARLVTVLDGSPAALSWLGAVRGMSVAPLGVDHFGQSADVPDIHAIHRIDADAIIEAAASLLVARQTETVSS